MRGTEQQDADDQSSKVAIRMKENSPVGTLAEPQDSDGGLTFGDLLRMLRRHVPFILTSIVVCTLVALIVIALSPPVYVATASIRMDPSRSASLGFGVENGAVSDDALATEIAVIMSDQVAIEALNSLSDAEFKQYTGQEKKDLAIAPGATTLTPAQESLLQQFKSSMLVRPIEGTEVVTVSVRSKDPNMAALLANRTLAAYVRQTFDSRYGSVQKVTQWLSAEMETLRDRAQTAQKNLAAFEERNNILGTAGGGPATSDAGGSNTITDRLRILNTTLTQAQSERITKEAQLKTAMTGGNAVLEAMFPSTAITTLETERGRLYVQSAQLSAKWGSKYPPLAEINADLARGE